MHIYNFLLNNLRFEFLIVTNNLLIFTNNKNICVFFFQFFQNLEVKMSLMCEEDKAYCECIITETSVNIFTFIFSNFNFLNLFIKKKKNYLKFYSFVKNILVNNFT